MNKRPIPNNRPKSNILEGPDENIGINKKWSIMVYMAGSMNLGEAARDSLMRMKEVGSTEHFHVLAQFDSGSEGSSTKRYYLTRMKDALKTNEMLKSFSSSITLKNAFMKFFNHKFYSIRGMLRFIKYFWSVVSGKKQFNVLPLRFPERLRNLIVNDKNQTLEKFIEGVLEGKEEREILHRKLLENRNKLVEQPELIGTVILDSALEKDSPKSIKSDLGNTDTGDPHQLKDFIEWGRTNYPSDHTMVVIWGHGDGLSVAWDASPSKRFRTPMIGKESNNNSKQALGLKTSRMKEALSAGGKPIDIIGFNSCEMGMFEVYCELSNSALFGIGSEGFEPTSSWPFDKILGVLDEHPDMKPEDLAVKIVNEYHDFHKVSLENKKTRAIDLSACNLSAASSVEYALNDLLEVIFQHLGRDDPERKLLNALISAQFKSQSYNDGEYADLYDLCMLLQEYCPSFADIQLACNNLLDTIKIGSNGMVLNCQHEGHDVRFSNGLSIYFPLSHVIEEYSGLEFIKNTRWKDFLTLYLKLAGRHKQTQVAVP